MSIRLAVTLIAAPGKGGQLAQVYKTLCTERAREPGCEQYEIFQSVNNPDRLVLLERWADQAALDAHAKLMAAAPRIPEDLRIGSEREDYAYNRTR